MTEKVEKAYYLKEEELAVLLSIAGMRQLYGFQMDDGVDSKSVGLHRLLFGMAKKGILSTEGGRLRIQADIEVVVREMAKADNVLLLSGGEEYAENCIYIAEDAVFVQTMGTGGRRYRIELVGREETAARIREYGWKVPGAAENRQTVPIDDALCRKLTERARSLYDMNRESLLQQKDVRCSLIQYAVSQRRKLQQFLILGGVLEDYIVAGNDGQDLVWVYSDEKARELLDQLVGGLK